MDDIKEYLYNVGYLERTIIAIEEAIKKNREERKRIKATIFDERTQGGECKELVDYIHESKEYERVLITQSRELTEKRSNAMKAIYSLKSGLLQTIIIAHYINGHTWERIAEDTNFNLRHVHRLKDIALRKLKLNMSLNVTVKK